jgi:hypothetical protein
MRILKVCLGIILSAFSLSSFAEETTQKEYGVSYGGSTGLAIRKSVSEKTLVFAGIGLGYSNYDSSSSCCGSNSGNSNFYALTLGTRRYLSIEKLSKFIDVELHGYYGEGSDSTSGTTIYQKGVSVYASYGVEYFLSANISIEGKAGFRMNYSTNSSSGGSSSGKSIDFPAASTAITYYW